MIIFSFHAVTQIYNNVVERHFMSLFVALILTNYRQFSYVLLLTLYIYYLIYIYIDLYIVYIILSLFVARLCLFHWRHFCVTRTVNVYLERYRLCWLTIPAWISLYCRRMRSKFTVAHASVKVVVLCGILYKMFFCLEKRVRNRDRLEVRLFGVPRIREVIAERITYELCLKHRKKNVYLDLEITCVKCLAIIIL